MKTTHLNRIGVVVYDLDATVKEYERIYGITKWEFADNAPTDGETNGRRNITTPGTWRSAVGSTVPREGEEGPGGEPARALTFELIQPVSGESPFMEHLRTKREGICFIQVAAEGDGIEEHFASLSVPCAYRATVGGEQRSFYDTRERLGGFYVEMVTKVQEPISDQGAPSPLPTQGMYHFGVLVHDVLATLDDYRAIFGIQRFEMKTWETGFGRLDAPQYRGEKVDHGYFTAQGFAGDFGFEIIQCNHGPSHYNREFFDIRGPGIHHIFSWMTKDDAQWQRVVDDMTAAGHPLCMGSTLRGEAAEFGYFDLFDALGGYLVEGVVRRRPAAPEYQAPDWVIDFEEQA
ncbi:hypothetical protein [Corynebacterium hindlerae]|uniref:hypothetical protein n=1 Tax=Corynebacterium hindlerae TaxID=699041 RepID=UPI003AAB736E